MNDELFLALGRLEGKMDALIQMQHIQQEELKAHDARIRVLEHARGTFLGAAAVVGAVSGGILNFVLRSVHL
jgi:hypothetical protein